MNRSTAREIAMHLAFELAFSSKSAGQLLERELTPDTMYEIMYMPDVPNKVAINEAVEIAKKYVDEDVVKFINGILGSFVRMELPEQE